MTLTDALNAVFRDSNTESRSPIDRKGMIQDLRQMIARVWARNNNSLSGPALQFKAECSLFLRDLTHAVYSPDLGDFDLEIDSHGFRCSNCRKMQNAGTPMIWISDGTMMGDPMWAILEERRSGNGSGWCVPCVRELVRRAE